jgi:hypothetical protein
MSTPDVNAPPTALAAIPPTLDDFLKALTDELDVSIDDLHLVSADAIRSACAACNFTHKLTPPRSTSLSPDVLSLPSLTLPSSPHTFRTPSGVLASPGGSTSTKPGSVAPSGRTRLVAMVHSRCSRRLAFIIRQLLLRASVERNPVPPKEAASRDENKNVKGRQRTRRRRSRAWLNRRRRAHREANSDARAVDEKHALMQQIQGSLSAFCVLFWSDGASRQ